MRWTHPDLVFQVSSTFPRTLLPSFDCVVGHRVWVEDHARKGGSSENLFRKHNTREGALEANILVGTLYDMQFELQNS